MEIRWWVCAAALISVTAMAQEPRPPETPKEKVSYGIGVDAARNFRQGDLDLDPEMLIRGLRDGFAGERILMTDDEIRASLTALQRELEEKQAAEQKARTEKNRAAGEAFLAANRTAEGVVALPSGLQYRVLTPGEGKRPTPEDTVTVHYRGTLIDGSEFDSSYQRGEPAEFALGQIIAGWKEALPLMPVGSKWRLFLPPALAYGERGMGAIEPYSVLVFEVELLSIVEPKAAGE